MEKFYKDLREAQVAEKEIGEFLKRINPLIKSVEYNDDKKWDIKTIDFADKSTTFEIKTDNYEKYKGYTGNMMIETLYRGNPSGIMATEADYFIYYYQHMDQIWVIKTKDLKEYLNELKKNHYEVPCEMCSMGDDNLAWGFKLKRDEIVDKFLIFSYKSGKKIEKN